MAEPGFEVQKAIVAALNAGLSVPVYDRVPQGAQTPYVTIDSQVRSSVGEPLNSRRDERFMYLSVWSTFAGQEEVTTIMADMDTVLHRKSFPMATGRIVAVFVQSAATRPDADGRTFQGRMTLRIITEH